MGGYVRLYGGPYHGRLLRLKVEGNTLELELRGGRAVYRLLSVEAQRFVEQGESAPVVGFEFVGVRQAEPPGEADPS